MSEFGTRRNFLERINMVFAGLAFTRAARHPESDDALQNPKDVVDYYDKLGVTKRINAAGTYTYLTGAVMPPSVQAAVAQAAKHPVFLEELQRAAGEYLAKRLHCEAAMVTAGAASAITLATAACMTVANGASTAQAIPTDMEGLKDEVLVQKPIDTTTITRCVIAVFASSTSRPCKTMRLHSPIRLLCVTFTTPPIKEK